MAKHNCFPKKKRTPSALFSFPSWWWGGLSLFYSVSHPSDNTTEHSFLTFAIENARTHRLTFSYIENNSYTLTRTHATRAYSVMMGFRDVTFDPKGVDAIIKTNIKRNFDGVTYDSSKNEERTSALVNDCVKGLQSLNIPFKFAVNAIVVQNVSAGLATSAGFYWDSAKDGTSCVVPSLSYLPFVSFVHTISLADIYVGILSIVCVRQDSQRPNGRTSTTRLLSPFLPWASNHTRIRFGDEWGGGSNWCVANEQTSKPENFRPPQKNSSHDAPTDSPIL